MEGSFKKDLEMIKCWYLQAEDKISLIVSFKKTLEISLIDSFKKDLENN